MKKEDCMEKKNSIEEELKNLILTLGKRQPHLEERNVFHSVLKDKDFLKKLNDLTSHRIKDFIFLYNYDYSCFTDVLLSELFKFSLDNDNLLFLMKHYDFVEIQFKKLITKIEDHPCSADKSGFIMTSLINYFKDNKPIVLNYDQEYTYHLPKLIFNNEEKILKFFDAVHRLYYGQTEIYFNVYNEILESVKVANNEIKNNHKEIKLK